LVTSDATNNNSKKAATATFIVHKIAVIVNLLMCWKSNK